MRDVNAKDYCETHPGRKYAKKSCVSTIHRLVSLLLSPAAGMRGVHMTERYLPASRVKAGSLKLGRLSVRTSDNREIGKLVGFLIDPAAHRICSLIVESDATQVEVGMSPLQFDPESRSIRMIDSSTSGAQAVLVRLGAARQRRGSLGADVPQRGLDVTSRRLESSTLSPASSSLRPSPRIFPAPPPAASSNRSATTHLVRA